MKYHHNLKSAWIIGVIILLLSIAMSVCLGAVNINIFSIIVSFINGSINKDEPSIIIIGIRITRALIASCVGATLAYSGAVLQGLFKNPLADPYVIGTSSGASLGAVIVIVSGVFSSSFYAMSFSAFFGGLGATLIVYAITKISKVGSNATSLLLTGSALSSFFSALVSILLALKDKDLHKAWFWLLGGFSGRSFSELLLILPALIFGFVFSMIYSRALDILSSGDEQAISLGLKPEKTRIIIGIIISISVSASVSLSGAIGFVGLISPHIARRIVGPVHKKLIPYSALCGAILLILSDIVSRVAFAPIEMPVGAMTALLGSPFFIYKIASKKGQSNE